MTLQNSEISLVAISPEEYDRILKENAELKRRNGILEAGAENFLTKQLQDSQKYEFVKQELAKSNTHLSQFLDEFEGQFDNDETCSPEMAVHYQAAAKHMSLYGRDAGINHFNSVYNRVEKFI